MKKKKADDGSSFEEAMLKLLRTLPKVLKYLPGDKAKDAKSFMMSFQYWLGGSPENLQSMLLSLATTYVPAVVEKADMASLDQEGLIAEPVLLPDKGIWHPLGPEVYQTAEEYFQWYETEHAPAAGLAEDAPVVGVVLQKSHINTGDAGHYVSLISELEARGAKVVCIYSGGLDFSGPVKEYFFRQGGVAVDSVINLTGFALVGGPASQDHPKAVDTLKSLGVPYLCSVPLVFQSFQEWEASELGLHPVQVALQVSLPELDGAIEPIIYAGREGATGKSVPLDDRISTLAQRALKWGSLKRKENKDKKLAITIFSFPPDKGNVGTAAYLDVFGSILAVAKELKGRGYDLGETNPDDMNPEDLMDMVLNDKEAKFDSPTLNVVHKMTMEEYERLCPYQDDLRENWGPPPGHLNSDGQNLLVFGAKFGNVFIGVQPSFGYEGDPMRLLFSKSASPHHGFAAYYTYLESVFDADAVLHFGTHGSLEFMPGKQVGMSGECYPDRLAGTVPNLYYYAANNPSEATIAKRRSYANTISYLTPPAENAGLYKGLKELQELISSFQGQKDSARGVQIVNTIVEKARQCNMENDVELPAGDAKDLDDDSRQKLVGGVYRKLMEIESRLLPCGLHIVGCPPSAEEAVATLVNIGSIDRPELDTPLRGMPGILANSVGRSIEEVYRNSDKGELADVELLQEITLACRASVETFVADKVSNEGRVDVNLVNDFLSFAGVKAKPYMEVLEGGQFAGANKDEMDKMFDYLNFCLLQVVKDNEMGALQTGLRGQYVEPGPGGDPIRNPDVLPTGKNIHALDPQAIPTSAAIQSAKVVVERLLERQRKENDGKYPESIALVLWGTDNIKTYGESLAQVMLMVGVMPVSDALGRVNKLEVIPLEELGRPRVDVVVNCSGVFRDLFINQMNLLDRAVKLAAEQDEPLEMNFVRKHALEMAEEQNIGLRDASTRVFSNSSGSYSSNINLAVENSSWSDEQQLQDMYTSRKSFAFNSDRPGSGMDQNQEVFKSALKKVDVTFQNLDSSEISLTDVSHYFDSDPTKLVAGLREDGKTPAAFIADTTTANAQVRSLAETVRLDSRTKLLNPKWYEGMMNSGYEGVREIQNRLTNTMGWSATSGQVDNWVYEDANSTFVEDEEMQKRLMDANPNSFRKMVATFLEANGRGYWDTSEENLERLRTLYAEVEDKIEGVE